MLDTDLKDQLRGLFSQLQHSIELVHNESDHADQNQLLEMLTDLCTLSDKILLKSNGSKSAVPQFHIEVNNKDNGIYFRGIPGGHEFTSLVLAILNSDHKGKFPDEAIVSQIKKLKGPIEIKTYISLSCENCPDVVQALNQMAVLHGNFKHEMIDGAYAQDEIKDLGIQGVPSVVANGQLVHSGRIQFIDLLDKLVGFFGLNGFNEMSAPQNQGHYDVVVIGGGPAGVSAAIYSARKGLKTAIIAEKIGGQVQETKGIENLISVVYTEGPKLAGQLQEHLSAYPIKVLEHRRVKNLENGLVKKLGFESGESLTAKSIIVATGAKWRELGIPGEKEYIGRGVAFCPHCDGPYYKGKKVAVVGGGNSGVEAAIDLAGIVRELILFEFQDQLKADQVLIDRLKGLPNVSIVTSAKTSQIHGDGQKVIALEYQNRTNNEVIKVNLDGVFVQIGLLPNSGFLRGVVETTKFGEIIVDNKGRTSQKGIYAAGDVTTVPYKQIIIAMGEGAKAALAAFEDCTILS
jgi:alkyl hydroperoxide reductase subunit F